RLARQRDCRRRKRERAMWDCKFGNGKAPYSLWVIVLRREKNPPWQRRGCRAIKSPNRPGRRPSGKRPLKARLGWLLTESPLTPSFAKEGIRTSYITDRRLCPPSLAQKRHWEDAARDGQRAPARSRCGNPSAHL